jgi:hypothetical protein
MKTIASNAGVEGAVIVGKVEELEDPNMGYDAASGGGGGGEGGLRGWGRLVAGSGARAGGGDGRTRAQTRLSVVLLGGGGGGAAWIYDHDTAACEQMLHVCVCTARQRAVATAPSLLCVCFARWWPPRCCVGLL